MSGVGRRQTGASPVRTRLKNWGRGPPVCLEPGGVGGGPAGPPWHGCPPVLGGGGKLNQELGGVNMPACNICPPHAMLWECCCWAGLSTEAGPWEAAVRGNPSRQATRHVGVGPGWWGSKGGAQWPARPAVMPPGKVNVQSVCRAVGRGPARPVAHHPCGVCGGSPGQLGSSCPVGERQTW